MAEEVKTIHPPTIHLNGTSAKELTEQLKNAYLSLTEASQKLRQTAPNMRDFYVQTNSHQNYEFARIEHFDRLKRIEDIKQELVELCNAIHAQERK